MFPQPGRGLPGDTEEEEEEREHRDWCQMGWVHVPTLTSGKLLNS